MPKHIKYFERIMLGTLALTLVLTAITGSEFFAIETGAAESVALRGTMFVGVVSFVFALVLALVFLTSRKRSRIAKWALVVMFAFGVSSYFQEFPTSFDSWFAGIFSTIQVLAQFVALYLLFTKESRDWLKQK